MDQVQENEPVDFVRALQQQVFALGAKDDWTLERLIAWLDRHIDHQDIPVGESAEFLRRVVRGLMARDGITDVGALALDRFRLRDQVEARIREHRDAEQRVAFQQMLLPGPALGVCDALAIDLATMAYEPSRVHEGSFRFTKHYFGPKVGEPEEQTPSGALREEFRCACHLDSLPAVRFWVRNLPCKATSFRLQTSSDWFYPDFICRLSDGRTVVIEYKGRHLVNSADAEEKRAVGAVWASRCGDRYVPLMPSGVSFAEIDAVVRV